MTDHHHRYCIRWFVLLVVDLGILCVVVGYVDILHYVRGLAGGMQLMVLTRMFLCVGNAGALLGNV